MDLDESYGNFAACEAPFDSVPQLVLQIFTKLVNLKHAVVFGHMYNILTNMCFRV